MATDPRIDAYAARKPPLRVPAHLKQAVPAKPRAGATFETLSPSHRREYLEWITDAKTAPAGERRLATTARWLEEGEHRDRKYDR